MKPKFPRQRGGAKRAEKSKAALNGVDTSQCDHIAILQRIASDESAPAAARVAAIGKLMRREEQMAGLIAAPDVPDDDGLDELTRKAIAMQKARHGR